MTAKATVTTHPELGCEVVTLESEAAAGGRLRADIAPALGSNLFGLRLGELDLIHCDLDRLRDGRWTGTPILWPIPNRVRGKQYRFGSRAVSLADVVRREGNWPLIHGLVDERAWESEPPEADGSCARLRTWVELSPGAPHFEHFPFSSRLTLEFELSPDGLRLDYRVDNLGDERLPFAFAPHPYFALLDGAASRIDVPAESVMEADADLLPTGRLIPVEGAAGCDLRVPLPAVDLELDHVFTDLGGRPCRIVHPRSGVSLELRASEDFTHVVVYTLKAATEGYACIENQTGSTDAINLHTRAVATGDRDLERAAHLLVVEPGGSHAGRLDWLVEGS